MLDAPDRKRAYNERLFTEVAPRYDIITRLLSFGRDAAWKRAMVQWLPSRAAPVCVDIACGTGDLVGLLLERYPGAKVTGIDLTPAMLERARRRFPGVAFVQGDMGRLAARDGSVDVMTGGYALRNAPDLEALFREVGRVLKPGGTAAFLDFSRPDGRRAAALEHALLKLWGGFWGLLLHSDPHVYGYIADSLAKFPARSELHRQLAADGLRLQRAATRFFGIIEILLAEKA